MKFLISFFLLVTIISCSSDNDNNNVVENVNVNGNWKPYKYEFRGKTYMVNDCELKGQLLINGDFSGVYERYGLSTSETCTKFDSFVGKWTFDNLYSTLTLTYNEGGTVKTLKKEIDSFSSTELRIYDNSKNLDTVPGNDEAVLIFIKQ
ncbi:hypothetical protein CEY12_11105 [Chryseobacterium sp. T16E-39]|uniref:lipocalin family protein n=1 Tax=Chryseobacterium sp. T16E-39 TaxID=2015076 RepID=UPI000B5B0EDF|nr:lipocalin family protein [Chryseobacterium sp. T16E-39]ASK30625.1 hypothetical protein CEY12_11105 [Chryseobacterium sp. T16E-39]